MLSRHVFVLSALLAASFTSLGAQEPAVRGPTRFGALAGVNVATLRGEGDIGVGHLVGFVGGAYLALPLTAALSFRPELLYAMKGARTVSGVGSAEVDSRVKLRYVEVPLLLAVDLPSIPVSASVRPQLYAGPSVALKVSCHTQISSRALSLDGDCEDFDELDEEVALKTFDVGAMIGGALQFDLRRGTVSLGARYTFGLTNIVDGGETKNRVLGVVASYELPIGR